MIQVGVFETRIMGRPSVLVGQALYILFDHRELVRRINTNYSVFKYDLGRHCLSVIDLPVSRDSNPLLISPGDGGLGAIHLDSHGLCLVWGRWR